MPRTAENLISGFITLLPGGEATYEQLAESGVIAEAGQRIEGAMARLGISLELITGTFLGIWDTLTLDDLLDPIGAFDRILDLFGEPLARLFEFVGVVIEVVVTLILRLMNFPSDLLGEHHHQRRCRRSSDIKRDPVGFLLNMLAGAQARLHRLLRQHPHAPARRASVDWLFRGLAQARHRAADRPLARVDPRPRPPGARAHDRELWEKLGERIGQEHGRR